MSQDTVNVQRSVTSAGADFDTYVIAAPLVDDNAEITISDTGANKIQLIGGVEITASQVATNALLLTLSNGARITILDASGYTFETGGNPLVALPGIERDYASFAQDVLGVAVPAPGQPIVEGGGATINADGSVEGAANQAPLAVDDTARTDEDVAVTIDVLANDSDPDGDALSVTEASAGTGSVAINGDGTLAYTPGANLNGTDTIDYTVSDGNGGTDTASVTVTIDPVADFTIAAASDSINEGAVNLFTVTTAEPVESETTVLFQLRAGDTGAANQGTASTNLNDFASGAFNPASATIAAGQSTATFSVAALNDGLTELPETYSVEATIAGETHADTVTLLDGTGSGIGQTFVLTTGSDTAPAFTGTANADAYIATDTTLTTGDALDGSGGTDILNVTIAAGTAPLVSLNSIETVAFTSSVAALGGGAAINAGNWVGVSTIGITGLGQTITDSDLTAGNSLVGLQNALAFTLKNLTAADGEAVLAAQFAADALGSATATLELTVQDVRGENATETANILVDTQGSDGFTTLALTSIGTNDIALEGAGAGEIDLAAITLAGTGDTTLAVDGTNAIIENLVSVDAGAASGALTTDLSASTKAVAFTGSSGENTVTFGDGDNTIVGGEAGDSFTLGTGKNDVTGNAGNDTVIGAVADFLATDSIDLGAGSRDELRYSDVTTLDSTGVDAAARAVLDGYQGIEVIGSKAAVTAIDGNHFAQGIFNLSGDLTAAVTASDLDGDRIVLSGAGIILGGDGTALTVSGALPGQSVTIELDDADLQATDGMATNTALTVSSGISSVTIVSTSSGTDAVTNTIDLAAMTTATHTIDNASAATFIVTGDQALTIDSGLTAGFTKAVNFDASAATAAISVVGSASADILKGGAGEDTLDGEEGADVLTGNGGADSFVFVAGETGTPSDSLFETITDFEAGIDIIDYDDAAITIVQNATASAGSAAIDAEGIASFDAADDTLGERITAVEAGINAGGAAAAGQAAIFEHAGNSYVFISDGTDGVDANDVLVQLSGVTGLTDSTIDAAGNLLIA